jgi:hypothetical protein
MWLFSKQKIGLGDQRLDTNDTPIPRRVYVRLVRYDHLPRWTIVVRTE